MKKRSIHILSKSYFLLLILVTPWLCGCPIVAGTIDSFRRVGLTEGSREGLLAPAVTKYNEAIGWGDISGALAMATDSYRATLRDQLMKNKDKIKVIESSVDLAEFENSAYEATVFMTIKAYKVPYYIAETTKNKQFWEFSVTSGWKISKQEALGE